MSNANENNNNITVPVGTEENEDMYDTDSSEIVEEEQEEGAQSYNGPFDFEIVGLMMASSGRACCQHDVCGTHLMIGDVVRISPTIITHAGGVDESALAVAKVIDGTVGCRVGFVPRVQAHVVQQRITEELGIGRTGRFAIVRDIYNYSTNEYKVNKSKRNYGMASCIFIDNVLSYDDE